MPQPPPDRVGLPIHAVPSRWQTLPADNRQKALRTLTRLLAQQLLRPQEAEEVTHEQE
jgi:hypothetical protein